MWEPKVHYTEKDFDLMLSGKRILYIPIISSINRETNKYNLDADGNVNRFITAFSRCNKWAELQIAIPSNIGEGQNTFIQKFILNKKPYQTLNFIKSKFFGIHAGEQRSDMFIIFNLLNDIRDEVGDLNDFDYIIADSQYLIHYLIWYNIVPKHKIIFWNYLCSTMNYQRSFTSKFVEITKDILGSLAHVIVTSPDLYEYCKENMAPYIVKNPNSLIYLPRFVDRNLEIFREYDPDQEIYDYLDECKKNKDFVIYLPFRLTDEAYKFDRVVKEFIYNINEKAKESDTKVKILYSDPNNSGMMATQIENYKDVLGNLNISYVNVNVDRNTFYTIIDHPIGVNIPYFEDLEFANHAAIWEFKQSNANIWVLDKYDRNPEYGESDDTSLFKKYKLLYEKPEPQFIY